MFTINEGVRLYDRHVLRDPRLIWPGLLLQLPSEGADSAPAQSAAVDAPASNEASRATEQPVPAGASVPAAPVSQPAEGPEPAPDVIAQAPAPIASPVSNATEEPIKGRGAPDEPRRL